jgi:hypothetical protein
MNAIPNNIGHSFNAMILTCNNVQTGWGINDLYVPILDKNNSTFSNNAKVRILMLVLHKHLTRTNMRFLCVQAITKVVSNHTLAKF